AKTAPRARTDRLRGEPPQGKWRARMTDRGWGLTVRERREQENERMQIETRACRLEERDALLALVNRVFDEGGDMGAAFPLLFGPDNLEGLRIVPGEQGPVAHV